MELGGSEKTRLFESKILICLLDQVPPHRQPLYVSAIGHFATGPVLSQFIFLLFPCQKRLIHVHTSTLAGSVVAAFFLKMTYWGFLLANSTRKEGITEFQVTATASHFRDQGSLTVGVSAFCFLAFLLEVEDKEEEEEEEEELTKL